jgi:hypothetical protein
MLTFIDFTTRHFGFTLRLRTSCLYVLNYHYKFSELRAKNALKITRDNKLD